MKATLEFDLPEDNCRHILAVHAIDWAVTTMDMDNYLRGKLKYEELPEDVYEALDKAREELYEIMGSRDISFDMIE